MASLRFLEIISYQAWFCRKIIFVVMVLTSCEDCSAIFYYSFCLAFLDLAQRKIHCTFSTAIHIAYLRIYITHEQNTNVDAIALPDPIHHLLIIILQR